MKLFYLESSRGKRTPFPILKSTLFVFETSFETKMIAQTKLAHSCQKRDAVLLLYVPRHKKITAYYVAR